MDYENINSLGIHTEAKVEDDILHIRKTQNVDYLLERNRDYAENINKKSDFRRVATVPYAVLLELRENGTMDDPVRMAKWLNDPDNAKFRAWGGRVNAQDMGA